MKKFAGLLLISFMLTLFVQAVNAGNNGHGAIVVRIDDICEIDITTEDTGEHYLASGNLHYVETPDGLWNLTCHGDIYEQTSTLEKTYNERSTLESPTIACYTLWDVTYENHVTLTPSGKAHIYCQGDLTP